MAIIYLEIDDEITGAVGRLRAIDDGEAVLMLPPGSRIGTSRINFRLVAREAVDREIVLVAVSDEPSVRALAVSAGVPAYDSLAAAQAALAELRAQSSASLRDPGRLEQPRSRTPLAGGQEQLLATDDETATRVLVPPAPGRGESGARALAPSEMPPAVPPLRPRRRRRSRVAALLIGLLVLAVVGAGAYAAWFVLPTATISLRPALEPVGPVALTVTADPAVAVVDVDAGVVPAQRIELPLSVAGDFSATGVEVTETRATGSVRFISTNTASSYRIGAGTIVSTADGTRFETAETISVPRANFETQTPGSADVAVRAVEPGPAGNVARDAIGRLPAGLRDGLLRVRNLRPTAGGERSEQPLITQEDYDAALALLEMRLEASVDAAIADPEAVPRGLTAFPDSFVVAPATAEPAAGEVVDTTAAGFTLTLSTTATGLAANEQLVDELATERLRRALADGQVLVGEPDASHEEGRLEGTTIVFETIAAGRAYRQPDRDVLIEAVRGRTVTQAQAILAPHGSVDIAVWPEFVDRLPDQAGRINLTIEAPTGEGL